MAPRFIKNLWIIVLNEWMNEWMNENECGKAWEVIGMKKIRQNQPFCTFLTFALPEQPTNRPTNRRTWPLIEVRGRFFQIFETCARFIIRQGNETRNGKQGVRNKKKRNRKFFLIVPPVPPSPPPPLLFILPSSSLPPPRILVLYSRHYICINNTTISSRHIAPVCVMKFDCLIVDEREIATCICKDGERER